MKHHNHAEYPYSAEIRRCLFTSRTERRIDAALAVIAAIAIGVGLASALVAWWAA